MNAVAERQYSVCFLIGITLWATLVSHSYVHGQSVLSDAPCYTQLLDSAEELCSFPDGSFLCTIDDGSTVRDVDLLTDAFNTSDRISIREKFTLHRSRARKHRRGSVKRKRSLKRYRKWRRLYREGLETCESYVDELISGTAQDERELGNSSQNSQACTDLSQGVVESLESSSETASFRVANGAVCAERTSPVARIRFSWSGRSNIFLCSGTLIAPDVVLTAAHCISAPGGITVSVLSVDVGNETFSAKEREIHPDWVYPGRFDPVDSSHDLGLIRLNRSSSITPVPVVLDDEYVASERMIVAGYGKIGEQLNNSSGVLRAAYAVLRGVSINLLFHALGDLPEGGTTCSGDSGGPILLARNETWSIAAVTSSGPTPCEAFDAIAQGTLLSGPRNRAFIESWIGLGGTESEDVDQFEFRLNNAGVSL